MKRKYLSALLMGVLTLSSVSTFTSCKDYDDDISNLQEQIDKLATADQLSQKVAELQALISSNKSDITSLQTKVAEALTAAQKAQTTADSKATLDEVKAELEKYATKDEVATVKATLEAAQKALEEKNDAALKDAVQKAQEAADKAVADAKAAVEEVKTDLASYKTTVASEQEVVNTALATLNTKVDAKADTTALNNAIAALTAADANAKAEILSEIASKYATKKQADEIDAALKEFAIKIEKQLGECAKTAEVQTLLAELKKNADVTYATKEEIKNLQTKEAVDEAINKAIDALKKGELAAVNEIAKEALKKANTAESEKGLAYLKALAAEGAASDAAKAAKLADDKAVKNQTDIKNIQDALGAGFDAKNTVAKAIQLINDQLTAKNTGLSGLDGRLKSIESKLALEDPDKSLVERVNKIDKQLKEIIGEYTTMVTEVSLVGSVLNNGDLNTPTNGAYQLQFMSGEVKKNYTFGKDEAYVKELKITVENQQKFVEHTPFNDQRALVVRVNPTNAVLTKASIKLVDSQGNDLNDVLEIGEPKQYTELLTRASKGTGLWKIPVNVKAGVASDKIEQVAKNNKHILYAVAIKNTETPKDAEDRYVASTYDITVPKANPFAAPENINDVRIWSESTMTEDHAIKLSDAKETTKANEDGELVRAKNDETINIDFKAYGGKIKYFYVVRDDKNTDTSSDQSELNAWKGYKYDGTAYGKVIAVDPKNPGTLKINIGGTSVADDEIGFRVFAIDYEGTVVNANGNSFVVYVGDEQNKATVEGNVAALYEQTDATNPQDLKLNETGWLKLSSALKDRSDATAATTAFKSSYDFTVGGQTVSFKVEFSADGKKKAADTVPYSELKYVKFICTSKMAEWKDDLKAVGSIKTTNKKGLVENEIKFSLTKVLPTKESTIAWMGYKWKTAQKDENGNYTAYVYPNTDDWTSQTSVVSGYKAMTQAINGLKPGTVFHVEGVKWDPSSQKYIDADFTDYPWKVTVPVALIDAKTPHKTTIGYNYRNISSAKNGKDYIIYVEEVQTIFACPLAMSAQSYELTKKPIVVDGKVTGYKDVNYLTYGSAKTVDDVNILDYIIGSNKFANEFEGKLSSRAFDKYAKIEAKLISKESGKPDYFTVSFEDVAATASVPAHKKMVFRPAVNASSPLRDVESELFITLTDAFGHNDMVYKFPFIVKKR